MPIFNLLLGLIASSKISNCNNPEPAEDPWIDLSDTIDLTELGKKASDFLNSLISGRRH